MRLPPKKQVAIESKIDLSKQIDSAAKLAKYQFSAKPISTVKPIKHTAPTIKPTSVIIFVVPQNESEESDKNSQAQSMASIEEDFKPIGSLTTSIRSTPGELPTNHAAARFALAGNVHHAMGTNRDWGTYELSWEPAALCHQPLYFEDVNLERLGYSYGIAQPFVSAAHFFARIPALPYLAGAENPRDCVYTLGQYQPGSYAPYQFQRIPLSLKGAVLEGSVLTGLIFLLP